MRSFKKWWYAERVDRVEKDTSQDMCPTNADAVIFSLIMLGGGLVVAVAMIIRFKAA